MHKLISLTDRVLGLNATDLNIFKHLERPVDGTKEVLFAGGHAVGRDVLEQVNPAQAIKVDQGSTPRYMLGYWGHGVSSYRYVYSWVEARVNVNLQFFYGGAYRTNVGNEQLIARLISLADQLAALALKESAVLKFFSFEGALNKFEYAGSQFVAIGFEDAIASVDDLTSSIEHILMLNEVMQSKDDSDD